MTQKFSPMIVDVFRRNLISTIQGILNAVGLKIVTLFLTDGWLGFEYMDVWTVMNMKGFLIANFIFSNINMAAKQRCRRCVHFC